VALREPDAIAAVRADPGVEALRDPVVVGQDLGRDGAPSPRFDDQVAGREVELEGLQRRMQRTCGDEPQPRGRRRAAHLEPLRLGTDREQLRRVQPDGSPVVGPWLPQDDLHDFAGAVGSADLLERRADRGQLQRCAEQ
jgi:hypothetical protein